MELRLNQGASTMPRYATTDELAARYRVTAETIRGWARRGQIPSFRVGRRPLLFDVVEVDRAIKARSDTGDSLEKRSE